MRGKRGGRACGLWLLAVVRRDRATVARVGMHGMNERGWMMCVGGLLTERVCVLPPLVCVFAECVRRGQWFNHRQAGWWPGCWWVRPLLLCVVMAASELMGTRVFVWEECVEVCVCVCPSRVIFCLFVCFVSFIWLFLFFFFFAFLLVASFFLAFRCWRVFLFFVFLVVISPW